MFCVISQNKTLAEKEGLSRRFWKMFIWEILEGYLVSVLDLWIRFHLINRYRGYSWLDEFCFRMQMKISFMPHLILFTNFFCIHTLFNRLNRYLVWMRAHFEIRIHRVTSSRVRFRSAHLEAQAWAYLAKKVFDLG